MNTMQTQILVAGNDTVVRVGLARLLHEQLPAAAAVIECGTLEELRASDTNASQLILIDFDLRPDFDTLSELSASGTPIILIEPPYPVHVHELTAVGVHGVLFRPFSREGLKIAVETVCNGNIYVGPLTRPDMLAEPIGPGVKDLSPLSDSLTDTFTQRETEVMNVVFTGSSNQEIAQKLGLSVSTVKSHLRRIMQKVNAHDRISLINRLNGLSAMSPQS